MIPVFANSVHVELGRSEIFVTFGTFQNSLSKSGLNPVVRLVFTHGDFLGIMEFLNVREEFLRVSYGDSPLNLDQVPQENMDRAIEILNAEDIAAAAAGAGVTYGETEGESDGS